MYLLYLSIKTKDQPFHNLTIIDQSCNLRCRVTKRISNVWQINMSIVTFLKFCLYIYRLGKIFLNMLSLVFYCTFQNIVAMGYRIVQLNNKGYGHFDRKDLYGSFQCNCSYFLFQFHILPSLKKGTHAWSNIF